MCKRAMDAVNILPDLMVCISDCLYFLKNSFLPKMYIGMVIIDGAKKHKTSGANIIGIAIVPSSEFNLFYHTIDVFSIFFALFGTDLLL